MGAEMTWPSRSMPMMAWNCWLASVSHCLAPSDVRLRLTDQTPVFNWALADLTAVPVIPAGPRTYRAVNPLALVPGSSTVAFFSSLVDGVGGKVANWGSSGGLLVAWPEVVLTARLAAVNAEAAAQVGRGPRESVLPLARVS